MSSFQNVIYLIHYLSNYIEAQGWSQGLSLS